VIDNRLAWQQAADASWQAGQALPDWDDTARIVAAHLKETAHGI
jgi:hypothetical protein